MLDKLSMARFFFRTANVINVLKAASSDLVLDSPHNTRTQLVKQNFQIIFKMIKNNNWSC